MKPILFALFAVMLGAVACGGATPTQPTQPTPPPTSIIGVTSGPTCPPPSPGPTPFPPVLIFPMPGATGVPANAAEIVFAGTFDASYGPGYYTLATSGGTRIPIGAVTSAPTPLPSPAATLPPDYSPNWPYEAVPIPILSPATTYEFGYTATGYDPNDPPACTSQFSQQVGAFTTK